jgi:DNA-directed RNA polymerase subunit RPC12/RpoP
MIRFKCIYCGQRLTVQDGHNGKKGKCPKCSHLVLVPYFPYSNKVRPATHHQISDLKLVPLDQLERNELAELQREGLGWLVPTYDELSLFLMTATLIILGIINPTMWQGSTRFMLRIWSELTRPSDTVGTGWFILGVVTLCLILFSGAAIALSLYHPFTRREKTAPEKWIMVIFAVVVNIITSTVAGYHLIKFKEAAGLLIIFPVWLLLRLMLRFIDDSCMIERDVSALRAVFGLISVIIIVLVCNYVFNMYWAITFSISIVYTASFDMAIQNTLLGRFEAVGKTPAE